MNIKIKKIISILIILVIVLPMATSVAIAEDDDTEDTINHLDCIENYQIEMEDKSFLSAPVATIFNGLANLLFGIIKKLGEWGVDIVQFSLSADMYALVSDTLKPFFTTIKDMVFSNYSKYIIAVAALYYLFQFAKKGTSKMIVGLITVILIVIVANIFFSYPAEVLSYGNDITQEISTAVLANGEDDYTTVVWDIIVHRPWQMINFNGKTDQKRTERILLTLTPGDPDDGEERQDQIDSKGYFAATAGNQIGKTATALFLLIISIVVFFFLLSFACLIIGYQFYTIILAILGAFVLLLALVPNYGLNLLKTWGKKLILSFAVKIVIVFCLSIILVIMTYIYTLTETYGFITMVFCVSALLAILWLKRDDILDLLTGVKSISAVTDISSLSTTAANPLGYLNRKVNMDRMLDYSARDETTSETTASATSNNFVRTPMQSQPQLQPQPQPQPQLQSPSHSGSLYSYWYDAKMQDVLQRTLSSACNIKSQIADKNQDGIPDNIQAGGGYTSEQRAAAVELLKQSYKESKGLSEQEHIKYTPFVARTDALRAVNPDAMFDNRDIERAARFVAKSETQSQQPIQPIGLQVRQKPEKKVKSGVQYFRANFGEEQGEKLYERFTRKYGDEITSDFSSEENLSISEVNRALKSEMKKRDELKEKGG